jgi:hypothetical protein
MLAHKELLELARTIEPAHVVSPEMAGKALVGLRARFPDATASGLVPDGMTSSTDALVALVVAALPGWHFSIDDRERPKRGPWSCSLRRSDVLDDDEILGTGHGNSLAQATLVAVLRVAAWR